MRSFVVGDVHGHLYSFIALLKKAGIKQDDEIIQLGDLGHFSLDTQHSDLAVFRFARRLPNFLMLWGNHDRAVVDEQQHWFRGYHHPLVATRQLLTDLKPQLSAARHGYLITHAGLHKDFEKPGYTAEDYNRLLHVNGLSHLINAVSRRRGGLAPAGGILWRDIREPLADIPQIFGHTCGEAVMQFVRPNHNSFCIDIASATNDHLAGIWLPSLEIVITKENVS